MHNLFILEHLIKQTTNEGPDFNAFANKFIKKDEVESVSIPDSRILFDLRGFASFHEF